MLLAIDAGNSSVKFGVFDGDRLVSRFEAATSSFRPEGELPVRLREDLSGLDITDTVISSVVTGVNSSLGEFAGSIARRAAVFIDRTFEFGLEIRYDTPETLGIDRLVAASAATKYGSPCIVCDFGTATTIDAVDAGGAYLGGTITPGIFTLARSLFQNTSNLPDIVVRKPSSVIGRSTVGSIESGVFYGYIGLVEGILGRMISELGGEVPVVATGGYVRLIADDTPEIDIVDENLVLDGLRRICDLNRAKISGH